MVSKLRSVLAAVRKFLTTDLKLTARWLGVIVSGVSVIFAIFSYFGLWSVWRGDYLVVAVAARFDKSYTEVAALPVRQGDKEWSPLMRLITKYSRADLPRDKEPRVFARFKAVTSAKDDTTGAEWTAPTTPIALIYKEWPGHGDVPLTDWRIVGTIEDLHNWIHKDEADFDFLVRTIVLGVLSLCVGIFLALPDKPKSQNDGVSGD